MLKKFLQTIVLSFFVLILLTPVNVLADHPSSVPDSAIEKPAFSLTATSEIVVVGGEALGFVAISTGGAATYAISATPTGMEFDTSTGQLSGSPSVVKSTTTYTVTASNVSGRATQQFRLTVNPAAPAFELSDASVTVAVNEVAALTVNSTGGHISRFSISPALPSGMWFNSRTGTLSGKPRMDQSATIYTVTGVGLGGSSTRQFVLTVNVKAPVFNLSRYNQTVVQGSAAGFTVRSRGGVATYSISPAAPAGMSFDTATGQLMGNPTSAQSATVYVVTATNVSGSPTQNFELTVTASFPAFTLSSSSQTVAQGDSAGFTVNSTGGAATYAISATPTGMVFDTSTGQLSGSPSVVKSTTTYTVTATNVSGRATRQFRLTVNPAAPAFELSRNSHDTPAGFASGFTVNSTGGHISRFSISPALPLGMWFNSKTGTLSGMPHSVQLATTYTVTGVGLGGSSTQQFVLTVNEKAPGFSLSRYSQTVVKGSAAGFTVRPTGGAISSYSIDPAAPTGMTFNTSTGVLSGRPTSALLATTYMVTASNVSGVTTQQFVLTVTASFPAFTLSSSSQTVAQGDSAGFTVNSTGGAATFAISATPPGMTFNTSTGVLSGSPSAVKSEAIYLVTASNVSGRATRQFRLTVNPATPEFELSRSFHNVAAGFASGFTVNSTGGYISRFSMTPGAPAGMLFNSVTGSMTGKPKSLQSATVYTVTAINASGSLTRQFELAVTRSGSGPSFVLSVSSQTVYEGDSAGFTVNSTGGAISSYSIDPAAPAGMSFNTSTGELSGSPSVVKVATTYTVTGTNSFGSATRTYVLTVRLAAPAFTLTLSSQTVYEGDSAGFTVNSTGGVSTFSISPAAPAGMTFNTSTGALSGSPSVVRVATTYTVSARNDLGSASQDFVLTVNVKVPAFTLSTSVQTVTQGSAAGFTVTSTGGAISSYSIDPAAPAGMSFNTSTGALSGSPSTSKSFTWYTVTATNVSGTATRQFVLTVTAKSCAQGGICSVGNIGPGGGKVVYVNESGFNCLDNLASQCFYMEAKDSGLNARWSGNTSASVLNTSDAIGAGYRNNSFAVAQSSTSGTAIKLAWDHVSNSKTDWNLPSRFELRQVWNGFMYQNSWTSNQHTTSSNAIMSKNSIEEQGYAKTGTPRVFFVRCFGR